jgi:serine-type D-Ala-D-Ala endopeptidase (penicillin-binding protein 7)
MIIHIMTVIFRQYLKTALFLSLALFNPNAFSSDSAAKEQKLQIASGSAMVVNLANGQVLYSLNPRRVRPIALITKLMTVMVAIDAKQSPDELLKVDISQDPDMRGVYSRVKLGSMLSRKQLMLLALMSSENRAAATLAHHYKGGYYAFIAAMNAKAKKLGMRNTFYVEPTGISHRNISTAVDLTLLLKELGKYPQLMAMSTTKESTAVFRKPAYSLPFLNTNHLIYNKKMENSFN